MSAVEHQRTHALGSPAALALVAGSMLGIGIFIAPPVVAGLVTGVGPLLLLWLFGGLAATCGALSVAELGAMKPQAGGDYPYLRAAFGPGFAFAAGWLQLLAIFPGALATMSVGAASFQLPVLLGDAYAWPSVLFGDGLSPATVWAVLILLVLTCVNHWGVVISGRVQILVTLIPVLLLLLGTCVVWVAFGIPSHVALRQPWFPARVDIGALAAAYLPVYFAFSGWYAALYVGSEIAKPSGVLPRALIAGTVGITLLYLALCLTFASMLSMSELASVGEAGTAVATRQFGAAGKLVVTFSIALAMLGSINATIMTGSRIAFAMAHHGDVWAAAGRSDARFGTPVVALWLQTAWTIVLIATQRFEALVNYTSSAMLVTGALTVASVLVLRHRWPQSPRPYRVPWYPWPPLLYVLSSLFAIVVLLRDTAASMIAGLVYFAAAVLVHRLRRRRT